MPILPLLPLLLALLLVLVLCLLRHLQLSQLGIEQRALLLESLYLLEIVMVLQLLLLLRNAFLQLLQASHCSQMKVWRTAHCCWGLYCLSCTPCNWGRRLRARTAHW